MFPFGITVTVMEPTTKVDPFSGEETANWSVTTDTVVGDCAIAPHVSSETNDEGHVSQVVTGRILYMPPTATISSRSRVRVDDEVWEVDGDPVLWSNPFTGWTPGWEVNLKRVTG